MNPRASAALCAWRDLPNAKHSRRVRPTMWRMVRLLRSIWAVQSIREGRSFGQTDTPKTGRREVPIAPPLARILAPVAEGPRDGYVALTADGAPWGQYGLAQAFERVRNRAGLSG